MPGIAQHSTYRASLSCVAACCDVPGGHRQIGLGTAAATSWPESEGLGFEVQGLGSRGLGSRVWGLTSRV
eukprot:3126935-Rhodomonas_salina.2